MYCPVCGAEYREGFTRCLDHDVELVEEPPDVIDEERPWPGRLTAWNARRVIRAVFIAFIATATLYVVAGVLMAVLIILQGPDLASERFFEQLRLIERISQATFRIGLGLFGILAASLGLEAYLLITVPPLDEDE